MNDNKKYVDLPGLQDYDKGVKDALGKIQTKVDNLEGGVSELAGSMSYYYTKKETDAAIDELRDEHIDDIQNLQNDIQNLSIVEANPEITGTAEVLTGLKVKEELYKIPTTKFVLRDEVTDETAPELKEIEIAGDVWKLGGSGGVASIDIPEDVGISRMPNWILQQAYNEFSNGKAVVLHSISSAGKDEYSTVVSIQATSQEGVYFLITTHAAGIYYCQFNINADPEGTTGMISTSFAKSNHTHDTYYTKEEVDNLIPENEIVCINIDRTYTTNAMNALARFTSKELAQIINAYDSNKSIVLKVSTANETLVISPYISYLSTYDNAQLNINYQFHYIQCNFIKSDVISNPIDDMEWTCSRVMLATQTGLESKADKEHTHDEYYTKEEINTKNEEFSTDIQNVENSIQDLQGDLDNKANKTHTHELSNITDFFMGSYKEYETAYAAGSIPVGALVIITDDNESDDATSPILGTGKLDSMILG